MNPQPFSQYLFSIRHALGMTQTEFAGKLSLSTAVYGKLERGKVFPTLPQIFDIAANLQVSPMSLLKLCGVPQDTP